MSELRGFVADLMERRGAAIEVLDSDGLEVLAPPSIQNAMGWPELARLGFGAQRPEGVIAIGLEGDWLDKFGNLLADQGRWGEREVRPAASISAPNDPERVLERALDLPNAVWRLKNMTASFTRCLMLTFRYTAVSDEKREGLIHIGFNLVTGVAVNDVLIRLRPMLAQMSHWHPPDPAVKHSARSGWSTAAITARIRPLLDYELRKSMEPFLGAMRRRLDRDRNRIHGYHDDLRASSLNRLAALAHAQGDRAEADRRRESLRVEAIEREYRAKLDDLRNNYALRVTVEWIQALDLYVPVHRFEVLIRRRKGERLIRLDWHPLVKAAEPPLCEAGLGLDRTRLVCDDKLHLTEPAGQASCCSCGKPFCRACFPVACPRCRHQHDLPPMNG